jgi:hypothetical protein
MTDVPLFLNGEGMRGGRVHPSIAHHRFLGETATAPRYRFYVYEDRFPALWPVASGGVSVPGELIELPLAAVRDEFLPVEPPELELGVVELADGAAAWPCSCGPTSTPGGPGWPTSPMPAAGGPGWNGADEPRR